MQAYKVNRNFHEESHYILLMNAGGNEMDEDPSVMLCSHTVLWTLYENWDSQLV